MKRTPAELETSTEMLTITVLGGTAMAKKHKGLPVLNRQPEIYSGLTIPIKTKIPYFLKRR